LYEDKLLPAQNNHILRLRTAIKRIKKKKTYTPGYLKDKEKAINNAEFERLAGLSTHGHQTVVRHPSIMMYIKLICCSLKLTKSKMITLFCVSLNTQQTKVGLGVKLAVKYNLRNSLLVIRPHLPNTNTNLH
jgi:hypothetical protein